MMKRSKKTRILSIVLALMTMVCMAIPAMAAPAPRYGNRYFSDGGGIIHCPGTRTRTHRDTLYQNGHVYTVLHTKQGNGSWGYSYGG